ncbi:hypothetical protein [Sorangium sp. So ce128]|uniref:hypothetical protein n=1 Tax=Sorangium sp. So ce128 TaxID=3133281 RepID=UPI003F5D6712
MKPWQTGVGGAVGGLVLGVAIGWVAHVPAPVLAPPTQADVVQPTGKLDAENARRLVEANFAKGPGVNCYWRDPRRTTDKTWTFSDFDETAKCGAALERAGLIKRGDCVTSGCGGCCKRALQGAGKADLDENGLYFACGSFKFVGLTSIMSEGNTATVRYEREFTTDDELLPKIEACRLEKPEPGRKERERKFKRDDTGKWAIVPDR